MRKGKDSRNDKDSTKKDSDKRDKISFKFPKKFDGFKERRELLMKTIKNPKELPMEKKLRIYLDLARQGRTFLKNMKAKKDYLHPDLVVVSRSSSRVIKTQKIFSDFLDFLDILQQLSPIFF